MTMINFKYNKTSKIEINIESEFNKVNSCSKGRRKLLEELLKQEAEEQFEVSSPLMTESLDNSPSSESSEGESQGDPTPIPPGGNN